MTKLYLMPDSFSAVVLKSEFIKDGFNCLSGTNENIIILKGRDKDIIQIVSLELKIKTSKIKEFPCDEIHAGNLYFGLSELIKNELPKKEHNKIKWQSR